MFIFSTLSIRFVFRFIIAICILAYMSSLDKTDTNIRKGLTWLIVLGAIFFVMFLFFTIAAISAGGIFSLLDATIYRFFHIFD